jgi:hypothetical protein
MDLDHSRKEDGVGKLLREKVKGDGEAYVKVVLGKMEGRPFPLPWHFGLLGHRTAG